ncbi:MAG: glutamate racemase [Verrucomicrobiota bacterium]
MASSLPLGIFDSGVGGLTVVNAIREALPRESIIYFGDTARVPYGNKSPDTVARFAEEISRFLLTKNVKAIVIACNTASAHALPFLQKKIPVPVFGVIRPGVEAALKATREGKIGIIGTAGTIKSMAYQNMLKEAREGVKLVTQAAPLLVPLIEENWIMHSAAKLIVEEYVKEFQKEQIDTLVLACTHYPLLKPLFAEILGESVALVDSSTACASNLREHLKALDQFNESSSEAAIDIFLTDLPLHFTGMLKHFLKGEANSIQVVHLPFE